MKCILTLLFICCSCIVNAQSWSIGASGGTSLWKELYKSQSVNDKSVRGWAAEVEARYTSKKVRWTYSAALNTGGYSSYRLDDIVGYNGNPDINVRLITDVQTYSLRLGAEYLVFDFGKCPCPVFSKFSLSVGASLAPVIYKERRAEVNPDNHNEVYYQYRRTLDYSALAGVQGRLSYRLTPRLNANLSSVTQIDLSRTVNNVHWNVYFTPDLRCSALLGVSYRL